MANKTYINSVTVQGFIGADAQPKELDGGKIVLNFSVATSRFRGEGEAREQFTEWHRITVWDKLAGSTGHLAKGATSTSSASCAAASTTPPAARCRLTTSSPVRSPSSPARKQYRRPSSPSPSRQHRPLPRQSRPLRRRPPASARRPPPDGAGPKGPPLLRSHSLHHQHTPPGLPSTRPDTNTAPRRLDVAIRATPAPQRVRLFLSLIPDSLRTVLAVQGSLRRATHRRALDRSGPFANAPLFLR